MNSKPILTIPTYTFQECSLDSEGEETIDDLASYPRRFSSSPHSSDTFQGTSAPTTDLRSLKRLGSDPSGIRVGQSSNSLRAMASGDLFCRGQEIPKQKLKLETTIFSSKGEMLSIEEVYGSQLCVVVVLRHFGCQVWIFLLILDFNA